MNRKLIRTALVMGWVVAIGAIGSFSAFSGTTENPSNTVTAGTVVVGDNDGGTALYSMANAKPGDSQESCVKVTYTGSTDADVKIYTPSTIGALGPYVNVKIEAGSQALPVFPTCTGFVADAGGALFDSTLDALPTSYGSGVSDYPGVLATKWTNTDAVVYRVTATLSASTPNSAQGETTGSHTLRWQAQSQ